MKILFLQIFVSLFIISNALTAQCTVQQTVGTGNSGPGYNSSEGQSATVCEAGRVTTIAFYVVVIIGQPLARIELYEGNSYSNLVRTVNNYVPNIGWNYINIDAGTGPAYSLDDNEMFRFRIWNISTTGAFPNTKSIDNPYPNGTRIHHNGSQSASLDLLFKFAMNGAPIPTVASINNTIYTSLTLAIGVAQPNDTIEIIEDFTETLSIPLPQGVILNIPSSKTVTLNGSFTNNGTIINNGTLIKNTLTNNVNGIYLGNGTFTGNFINNGTFKPGG